MCKLNNVSGDYTPEAPLKVEERSGGREGERGSGSYIGSVTNDQRSVCMLSSIP